MAKRESRLSSSLKVPSANRFGSYAAPSCGAMDDLETICMIPVTSRDTMPRNMGTSVTEEKLFGISTQDGFGLNALNPVKAWDVMDAAEQNNVALVNLLLQRGSHYRVANDHGETLLEVAARCSHHEVIEAIMEFVEEAEGKDGLEDFLKYRARQTKTGVIHYAMLNNQPETVRLLGEASPALLFMRGVNGQNALHYGARANAVDALKVFLELGVRSGNLTDLLHAETTAGLSPLHSATSGSHFDAVKLLLAHKADPFLTDGRGETCLFAPVATDDQPFLKGLIELLVAKVSGADAGSSARLLRVCNNQGHTVLHRAVSAGAKLCIEYLIVKCPALLLEGLSELPVHVAIKSSHTSQLAYLIQKTLEVRNKRSQQVGRGSETPEQWLVDSKKRSLMHLAVLVGDRTTLQILLKLSAEDGDIRRTVGCDLLFDDNGCTPLFYIAWSGKIEGLEAFLSIGDPDGKSWISVKDMLSATTDGRTVFYVAARNGHSQVLKRFMQVLDSRLKEEAVPIDCFMRPDNKAGLTPLHIAALHNRRRCMQILLDARANCTLDHFHRSPLHYAACKGYKAVCDDILDYQPQCLNWRDLQASTKDEQPCEILTSPSSKFGEDEAAAGKTALHYAAEFGNAAVVDLLLDKDAEILRDGEGQTPLDLAVSTLQEDTIRVIFNHHRWEEMLHKSDYLAICSSLISDMPDLAKNLLDNFYCIDGNLKRESCEVVYHLDYLYYNFQPTDTMSRSTEADTDSVVGKAVAIGRHDVLGQLSEDDTEQKQLWSSMKKRMREASRSGHAQECEGNKEQLACFGSNCLVSSIMEKGQHRLLLHPVIKAWTHKKWTSYAFRVHMVNLFIYLFYLISLTVMVVRVRPYERCPQFYRFDEYKKYKRTTGIEATAVLVQIFAVANILKEVVQLYKLGLAKYFTDVNNLFDWLSCILAFTFALQLGNPPSKYQWLVGAGAIFLSWINLILFFQKMTFFGIHVVMFLQILQSVIKALFVFILFVFAFGLAFYILMLESQNFTTVGESLMMVVSMAVGMISIPVNFFHVPVRGSVVNGTCSDPANASLTTVISETEDLGLLHKEFTWAFVIIFILIAPIILMNMLIGLAVGDIARVRDKAAEKIAAMQADLILSLETKFPTWLLKRYANFPVYRKKPNERKAWYLKIYSTITSVGKWTLTSEPSEADMSSSSSMAWLDDRFDRLSAQQRKLIEQVQSVSRIAEQSKLQQHLQGEQVGILMKTLEELHKQQIVLLEQLNGTPHQTTV